VLRRVKSFVLRPYMIRVSGARIVSCLASLLRPRWWRDVSIVNVVAVDNVKNSSCVKVVHADRHGHC